MRGYSCASNWSWLIELQYVAGTVSFDMSLTSNCTAGQLKLNNADFCGGSVGNVFRSFSDAAYMSLQEVSRKPWSVHFLGFHLNWQTGHGNTVIERLIFMGLTTLTTSKTKTIAAFQMIFMIALCRKMSLTFGKPGTVSLSGINPRVLL